MKVIGLFLASASAVPTGYESENFIETTQWELYMDSVMGGSSIGAIEQFPDYVHFTGTLNLIDGGFAGFRGYIDQKLTGYEGKKFRKAVSIFEVLRVSGRTPNIGRAFQVGVSRNNGGTWYHPLSLESEFKSFEVKFNDFKYKYHGQPDDSIPPPVGSQIRKVQISISDKNTALFEADINIIQGI